VLTSYVVIGFVGRSRGAAGARGAAKRNRWVAWGDEEGGSTPDEGSDPDDPDNESLDGAMEDDTGSSDPGELHHRPTRTTMCLTGEQP